MKKLAVFILAAAMFVSPVMSTAQAVEKFNSGGGKKEVTEGRRGYRHGRRRHRGGSGGAIAAGVILGGLLIGSAIAKSSSKPKTYYRSSTPTMYCDAYGNCWYQ